MTALCSGGTSSAKPGFASSLFIGPSAVAALLNNIPTVWAVPLAAYIGYVTYQLTTFCTTDPPAVPSFTAQDVLDLLNGENPFVSIPAAQKFRDLVGAYLWHEVCQCDSVTTPAPPTPPAAPTGMPVINPTINPPVSSNGACYEARSVFFTNRQRVFPGTTDAFDITPLLMNNPGGTVTLFAGQPQQRAYLIPAGATQYGYTTTTVLNGPATLQCADSFSFWNAAGGNLGNQCFSIPPQGTTRTFGPFAIPTNATQAIIMKDGVGGVGDAELDMTLHFYCGTSAPQPQQPCCPPDPIAQGLLDRILSMVTLIQRQNVPFAYVQGTAHAGLTGHGHFSVQGLLGCIVTLTATGGGVGVELGDPNINWSAGWISWGNADGNSEREWITTTPQVVFPPAAGQYTRLGYTLGPGVTATITELRREP